MSNIPLIEWIAERAENAKSIAATKSGADRAGWLEDEKRFQDTVNLLCGVEKVLGLLWYAWSEFNAIRARDGAPEGVDAKYWDELTEHMAAQLGDDAQPWPSAAAKLIAVVVLPTPPF